MPGFGVYLHFPYCRSKCPYCDFASKASAQVPHERYARAVQAELAMRLKASEGRRARSIYIGGGTPSLWEPASLGEVLSTVRDRVAVAPEAEVTLEANPGASEAERFRAFRALGINRLSIGVQSFDPEVLRALGRTHSADEAVAAYASARAAGFSQVCLDLIYGSPRQDLALARADAARAARLGPEHLSCYALTLEGLAVDVPMARQVRRGRLRVPDEDAQWEMGRAVEEELRSAGYHRYEISNFARPGREAVHNSLYWTGGEYLGLGCGACGFAFEDPTEPARGGRRWGNLRSPTRYLEAVEAGRLPEDWSEPLDAQTLLRERVVMGLRRVAGVDLVRACRELAQDPGPLQEQAEALVRRGLARWDGDTLALTERGLDLHSECSVAFV